MLASRAFACHHGMVWHLDADTLYSGSSMYLTDHKASLCRPQDLSHDGHVIGGFRRVPTTRTPLKAVVVQHDLQVSQQVTAQLGCSERGVSGLPLWGQSLLPYMLQQPNAPKNALLVPTHFLQFLMTHSKAKNTSMRREQPDYQTRW